MAPGFEATPCTVTLSSSEGVKSVRDDFAVPTTASVKKSNVPEAVPAPNNCSGRFGQDGLTWRQLVTRPSADGSHTRLSWAIVAELTGFDGVAAGAAAIDTLAAALTTPDAPAVRRLRAAVGGLDAAVAQALSGEGDRTALRRQLGRIIRTVENAPAGALGTNRSRLLDLARAARRRLIQ